MLQIIKGLNEYSKIIYIYENNSAEQINQINILNIN